MVARPPVRVVIEPMRLDDLEAVQRIEQASFTTPWPPNAYRSELETNRLASYLVGRVDGRIVAYGGMWLMVDEAHITTFAVHPDLAPPADRRAAAARVPRPRPRSPGARATLEVRLSNLAARRLYEKYGFRPVGLRPRYYSDNNEDALIMTTEPIDEPPARGPARAPRAAADRRRAGADRSRARPTADGR